MSPMLQNSGDHFEVYWPLDNQYYPGIFSGSSDDQHRLKYDDRDTESLNLKEGTWRYEKGFSSSSVYPWKHLESNSNQVTSKRFKALCSKNFIPHHVQGFEKALIIDTYDVEEREFVKHASKVPVVDVPTNYNVIYSHVLYKLKVNANKSLMQNITSRPTEMNKVRSRIF